MMKTLETDTESGNRISSPQKNQVLKRVSPGKALMARRLELGLSEDEVADHLKITVDLIRAMECGNYDAFHSLTYARGFVRAYAQLMRMDPAPLVAFFSNQEGAAPIHKNIRSSVSYETKGQLFTERKDIFRKGITTRYGWLKWVILAVVVAIAVVSYIKFAPMLRQASASSDASGQKAPTKQTPSKVAANTSGAVAGEPVQDKAPLKMTFTAPSFVQIQKDDGKTTVERFMAKPGETRQMDIEVPAVVTIGNIKGVSMEFRNSAVDLNAAAQGNTAKVDLK